MCHEPILLSRPERDLVVVAQHQQRPVCFDLGCVRLDSAPTFPETDLFAGLR
jgi:hypothetical protein